MSDSTDPDPRSPVTKPAVRARLLAARAALTPDVKRDADAAVRDALVDLIRSVQPRTVAAFAPLADEPGGRDLASALLTAVETLPTAGRLLLPVLLPDLDVDWAVWAGEPLVPAGRGLREPTGQRLGTAAIGGADLVVVPALAVDRSGIRLGRGGGSYDRALPRVAPSALVVVPLYDGELVDRLPSEPHDRRVTGVVLPGGYVDLRRQGGSGGPVVRRE
ncbi:MAG TPA: 5-formyltetrahydrofolate cyclo-ligase [Micromonosporaceae bacterium]